VEWRDFDLKIHYSTQENLELTERERETLREIGITILVKIREREDFRQVDQHIAVFPKKEKTIIDTTRITVLTMIGIEVQVERETSDS
jgi:hypothetical protein